MQKQAKKVSEYTKVVINVNKSLKTEAKTLNGAIKMLKALSNDSKTLEALESVEYGKLKKVCRKSKAGNYSPFFILQALYKLGLTKEDAQA